MTATKDVTLWCDEPDCVEWIMGDLSPLIGDARRFARGEGWTFRNGEDRCPRHST